MISQDSWFAQRERALLGERYETLLTPCCQSAARGVTVNALRCAPEQFVGLSAVQGWQLTPSPFCSAGFLVNAAQDGFRPGLHPYHHAGVFYSQEPSASAPATLLQVKPGMRVLDLCAAPGGKSSQLAAALAGQGILVANEPVAARAEILRQNLERMGVRNAVVLNETPQRIAAALPGWFDRILVDAPCSGEGMFRKEAQAVAQHNATLVEQCAALGAEILDCAAQLLAPGGLLVYSTCTFSPQEDEGQVGAFLEKHPEFSLCDLSKVSFGRPGEANRACGTSVEAKKCRRVWPADGGEGHFMAKLCKAGEGRQSSPSRQEASATSDRPKKNARRGEKQGAEAAGTELWQKFAQEYFPALSNILAVPFQENVLLQTTVLPPVRLHLLRAGVPAGSVQKGRFVPAHALFMAYGMLCKNREELSFSGQNPKQTARAAAWLRGEEIEAETAENGWCTVLVDGFPLGGGKVSGGRVKNHYPRALRNLK